jgi:hypothetical protein
LIDAPELFGAMLEVPVAGQRASEVAEGSCSVTA